MQSHWNKNYQNKMFDGIVRTLVDLSYVPELKKDLLSLGLLDSNGCKYTTIGGVLNVIKGAMLS